jgi:hypothetical protein
VNPAVLLLGIQQAAVRAVVSNREQRKRDLRARWERERTAPTKTVLPSPRFNPAPRIGFIIRDPDDIRPARDIPAKEVKLAESVVVELRPTRVPSGKNLADPNDPLATTPELLANAIEVIDEIRANVSGQNGNIPIVLGTEPEWFDASLEYVRGVLVAIKERPGGRAIENASSEEGETSRGSVS